jgi:hypothetical protein
MGRGVESVKREHLIDEQERDGLADDDIAARRPVLIGLLLVVVLELTLLILYPNGCGMA